jgi:hypothetical protein
MGTGLTVSCDGCGEEFSATLGAGFMGVQTRCTECGESSFAPHPWMASDDDPPAPERCECGGTFSSDAPVRCPGCAKAFTEAELRDLEVGSMLLWD